MDVLLQRHCAKHLYVIPEGLRELLDDIIREVLRDRPEQIYDFIADYLDALLLTRENARIAARFVETVSEIAATVANFLTRTGMSREEADRVVTVMQTAFRKHFAEEKAAKLEIAEEAAVVAEIVGEAGIGGAERAEEAARIIQNAFRNFRTRKERATDLLRGVIDWRVAARSAMRLYRRTGVTTDEANRAATTIKAAYKGYYTRKLLHKFVKESCSGPQTSNGSRQRSVEIENVNQGPSDVSLTSTNKGQEKSVRIDYGTVTPHVDLDDLAIVR